MKIPPKILLLAAVFLLACSACKKYPEDGKRSWRTPKHRIYSHAWHITEISIDGGDSTHADNFVPIAFIDISFKEDDLNYYEAYQSKEYKELTISNTPLDVSNRNYWHFAESKDKIYMVTGVFHDIFEGYNGIGNYYNYNNYYMSTVIPFVSGGGTTWDIRKLTDAELILEIKSQNHDIRLSFSK